MNIGIVGAGKMGIEIIRHLINHQFKTMVYDISNEQNQKAEAFGAQIANTPAELGECTDCSMVMVATEEQVEEAINGENGILKGAKPAHIILICSSVGPDRCKRMFQIAAKRGVHVLDSPVVFGQQGAIEGRLKALVGGDETILEKVRPALLSFCNDVLYMGEIGNGQITKTVNNMLHWTMVVANYEALLLSKKLNIHPARMREVLLQCPATNGTLEHWLEHNLTWPKKDMQTVMTLADQVNLPIPLHGLVDQMIRQLNKQMTHGLVLDLEEYNQIQNSTGEGIS